MPDKPYDRRQGRTSRERNEARAMEQAGKEFADSFAGRESQRMAGEMAALRAELNALKTALAEQRRNPDLRGDRGIEVRGNIITLRKSIEASAPAGTGTLEVKNEGTTLTTGATSVNFVGSTVDATVLGTDVTVTITASNGDVQKDGSLIKAASAFINFKGGGVSAAVGVVTTGADVTIPGVDIQSGGSLVTTATTFINFTGAVTVTTNAAGTNVAIAGDTTNPTNSGAGGANTAEVLKTGTNVVARQLKGTGLVQITQGTDDITLHVDESTLPADKTAVFFQYDGTDISAVVMTFPATVDGAFAP